MGIPVCLSILQKEIYTNLKQEGNNRVGYNCFKNSKISLVWLVVWLHCHILVFNIVLFFLLFVVVRIASRLLNILCMIYLHNESISL